MIEYWVMLKRGISTKPDVCIFRGEDRDLAIKEMHKYCKQNGFTVQDREGRFTIADIVLVEREPVVNAPIISETPYRFLFSD